MTARKRAEDILKTPISISAFTSADIQARGIQSITDLSAFTPSMKIVSTASGRNDRSFQQIIIRGFTPSSAAAQTTSLFIDGVPVSTATGIQTITDPERIEVLKGPQSAYFGRQTFAGAVNVVTKAPPKDLEGSVSGMLGTRNNRDVQFAIGGPIFGEVLGFRATVQEVAKDGSYENAGVPGQTLGDQRTRSGTLSLQFEPTHNLKIKAFGLLSANKDGPNATGFISAYGVTNPKTGAVIVPNQGNCSFNGVTAAGAAVVNQSICGTVPKLSSTSPSMNTANDANITNFLASSNGRVVNADDGVQGYGLVSRYYHLHLNADWAIGDTGITLSSLTGYNNERRSQMSDLDLYYDTSAANPSTAAGAPSYFSYPYIVEAVSRDVSQEVRASYEPGGPFHATIGASYLNAFFQGSGGGGNGALGTTVSSVVSGATRSKTSGVFFGVGYDITPSLKINFDGRYQEDHLIAYTKPTGQTLSTSVFAPAGVYAGGSVLVQDKYKNFMPRVIVNYDVTPETMVYASYSKGINPGAFNTVFLSSSPAVQDIAAAAGLKVAVKPETLNNYEIGLKGRLFDNAIRYSLSAYYGIWNNQINALTLAAKDPTTGLIYVIQSTDNTGKVRVSGLEAEVSARASSRLNFNFSGSINDTHILKLSSPSVTQLTGITDFRGKENPLTSKYSGAASAQYTVPIGNEGVKAFGRADFTYKSGVYTNAANILKTPAMTQVNLRLGVGNDRVSIEAFTTNLFNNRAYASAIDYYTFDTTFSKLAIPSGVAVALRDLRTFGLRGRYNF
ncbi:TonB-dependent receptor [Sphingomonas sp. 4RDLI-65]|uniref:TonB-dependent receptor n=1 Tax=Sphingomonas sp. 4RDLI-65 TaxID=3111641 RepID=UPI003C28644F